MSVSVVSRWFDSMRRDIEVRQFAALKLAVMSAYRDDDSLTAVSELRFNDFRGFSNPFLIRNAISFLKACEEGKHEAQYRDYFKETYTDAALAAGVCRDIPNVPDQAGCGPHFRTMTHPFVLFENPSDAYLRGYDRTQFCHETDAIEMCNCLDRALDQIASDNEIYSQLCRDIHSFVPVFSSFNTVHRSHTSRDLPGVIFLSHCNDSFRLAEAIVHEHGHIQLDAVLDFDTVVIDENRLFYSPWRDDPRPVHALLHAVYVFSEVTRFLHNSLKRSDTNREWIVRRLSLLTGQLRVGFSQLANCQFTENGRSILTYLSHCLFVLKEHGFF